MCSHEFLGGIVQLAIFSILIPLQFAQITVADKGKEKKMMGIISILEMISSICAFFVQVIGLYANGATDHMVRRCYVY